MSNEAKPETKNRPSILYCPVGVRFEACDPAELDPLVAHLKADGLVEQPLEFPRGTHLPDGRLDLCKQSIGPLGANEVAMAVSKNTQTRHWLLGANGLGNDGAKSISKTINESQSLETVYLGCNLIDEEGARPIAEALNENDHITGLWLKRNPIGLRGAELIAEMLRHNSRLRTLDLVHTQIGPEGVRLICQCLTQPSTSIRRLYLGGNRIGPAEAVYVAEMLRVNRSIHSLYLSVNRIGDEGLKILASAIQANKTLVVVSLASNQIGPEGTWSLVEKIQGHPTLTDLDLGYDKSTNVLGELPNRIGDDGAFALADLLESNPPLRWISVRNNSVTSLGANRLLSAFKRNSNLTKLSIGRGIYSSIKSKLAWRSPRMPSVYLSLSRQIFKTFERFKAFTEVNRLAQPMHVPFV